MKEAMNENQTETVEVPTKPEELIGPKEPDWVPISNLPPKEDPVTTEIIKMPTFDEISELFDKSVSEASFGIYRSDYVQAIRLSSMVGGKLHIAFKVTKTQALNQLQLSEHLANLASIGFPADSITVFLQDPYTTSYQVS